jgi:hypothetical protein
VAHGGPQREGLEDDRHAEEHERDRRRRDLLGLRDLVVALVEREEAAEREQHDRNHERPEVARTP